MADNMAEIPMFKAYKIVMLDRKLRPTGIRDVLRESSLRHEWDNIISANVGYNYWVDSSDRPRALAFSLCRPEILGAFIKFKPKISFFPRALPRLQLEVQISV